MTEHDHDRFLNLRRDDAPPSWLAWGPLIGLGLWALIGAVIWAVM